jgi:hypothetical protein
MKHVTIFNYYDWHVKAYAVYLLRQKGIWLDWSDFDQWTENYLDDIFLSDMDNPN